MKSDIFADPYFFESQIADISLANRMCSSLSDAASDFSVAPRYLKVFTSSSSTTSIKIDAFSLFTIVLLFSLLTYIPYILEALTSPFVSSCSSAYLSAMRSISLANLRLLISLPLTDIVICGFEVYLG